MRRHQKRVFAGDREATLPGIDLDLDAQLDRLARVAMIARDHPWFEDPRAPWRYGFRNDSFGPGESLLLFGLLGEIRPGRIIEIGAGWSTRAIVDIRDRLLSSDLQVTTIDPYVSTVIPDLVAASEVIAIERPVQEVGLETFSALRSGDVLFIDSSHVIKFGSDVQFLLYEVLPRVAPGVWVHFHDVMYPFEYPIDWVRQGRNWNEAYALRAFLTFNTAFAIELFAAYVWAIAPQHAAALLPRAAPSPGSSLWLRRR